MSTSTLDNTFLTGSDVAGRSFSDSSWESIAGASAHSESAGVSVRGKKIPKQDVAEVTAQLAIMAKSGVDIASALSSLASQCQRPALADVLANVRESVMAGTALSDALKLHPTVFEANFVATVAAGEASGRMAEVLQQLSHVQQNELRRNREVRALLTYPVLLLFVSSSVLCGLVIFVLPRFAEIFDQYEVSLPVITTCLLTISEEVRTRWWFWVPAGIGALGGLVALRKSEKGRNFLDHFLIYNKFTQQICQGMNTGRTCRLLGLMLENGVTLLESIRLTRQAINNSLYKTFLQDLEEAVINGQGLHSVLQHTEVMPTSAKEMLITAESTGNLNEVTGLLGEYYEEEAEGKLRQLVRVAEPAITVVMGMLVAIVVLAVMLPVFGLSSLASGGH